MNLVLFDFDGTITRSDTLTPFIRFAGRPARMLAASDRGISARHGFGEQGQADDCESLFSGRGGGVRQRGVEYATTALPRTLRQLALERIEWHKSNGDDVVVVSGSLDAYLGPCARVVIWTKSARRLRNVGGG